MTERVVIEGTDLNVTMQEPADPQRKRPADHQPADPNDLPRSPSGWTIDQMIGMKNPFHPEDK